MKLFFVDSISGRKVYWDEFFEDIQNVETFNTEIYYSNDYYIIIRDIIVSLLEDKEIFLIDTELNIPKSFLGNEELIKDHPLKKVNYPKNILEFKKRVLKVNNWKVNLFTSGTTGQPKKVTHDFKSINRYVKISSSLSSNIWCLAYNPTHIAGLQVIMQAILNANSIIRLFELSKNKVYEQIIDFRISHISATPTFYRLVLPGPETYKSIKIISSGGESFSDHLKNHIFKTFPNAKIKNIYASTEAGTLFASDGEFFIIKDNMKNFIRINSNEIEVHHSLIGELSVNHSEWYKTGDVVEVDKKNPFKFKIISRKTNLINVGGLNVNPNEIEDFIKTIPGVFDVVVYAKKNNVIGNILHCNLKIDEKLVSEKKIREILNDNLPKYKIPRFFNFVSEMKLTRTGKLSRV